MQVGTGAHIFEKWTVGTRNVRLEHHLDCLDLSCVMGEQINYTALLCKVSTRERLPAV